MKREQRDRKQKEGDEIIFVQRSRSSSTSSSDEKELAAIEEGAPRGKGLLSKMQQELSAMRQVKKGHAKDIAMGRDSHPDGGVAAEPEGSDAQMQGS